MKQLEVLCTARVALRRQCHLKGASCDVLPRSVTDVANISRTVTCQRLQAERTESLSCRDLRDVCEQTERRWASKLIRKEVVEPLPPLQEYLASVQQRLAER